MRKFGLEKASVCKTTFAKKKVGDGGALLGDGGHHVHLDVGSETLTEWKSESIAYGITIYLRTG